MPMRCFPTVLFCLCLGCNWQANSASHAVEVNPFHYGSATPVVQLANTPGYADGVPYDRRGR